MWCERGRLVLNRWGGRKQTDWGQAKLNHCGALSPECYRTFVHFALRFDLHIGHCLHCWHCWYTTLLTRFTLLTSFTLLTWCSPRQGAGMKEDDQKHASVFWGWSRLSSYMSVWMQLVYYLGFLTLEGPGRQTGDTRSPPGLPLKSLVYDGSNGLCWRSVASTLSEHRFDTFCSSQPSIVHWLSSPIFPCWLVGCSFVPPWWHPTKSHFYLPQTPQTHTFSESLRW